MVLYLWIWHHGHVIANESKTMTDIYDVLIDDTFKSVRIQLITTEEHNKDFNLHIFLISNTYP